MPDFRDLTAAKNLCLEFIRCQIAAGVVEGIRAREEGISLDQTRRGGLGAAMDSGRLGNWLRSLVFSLQSALATRVVSSP